MLRGSALMHAITADARAVPLYGDLGAEARGVGPWLLDGSFAIELDQLPLPGRLGISRWQTDAGLKELLEHAKAIRHLQTDDGQSFYLRYADTRVLDAVKTALPEGMQATVQGPLLHWTWLDRDMQPARFLAAGRERAHTRALKLTTAQFESLLAAGLPDRLALMLEELNEPELRNLHHASAFVPIRAAAAFLRENHIEAFSFQRAIARQAVLTGGAALRSDEFMAAVSAVMNGSAAIGVIDAWVPRQTTGIEVANG